MGKKILITGGCGFVGSNLAVFFKTKYPEYTVIAMDNLKRRGSELNIVRLKQADVQFIHGDIRNKEDFNEIGKISLIIDASAEPSVMAGITCSPDYMINTNILGTINCLNFAKDHGADFIFLSTSRVYPLKCLDSIKYTENASRFEIDPIQDLKGISVNGISECFPLNGARSFYGASKLAAELVIQEFHEFYGINTIINRCGVIAGPYQMGKVDQGFVVLWVASHFWKKRLGYFGYGGKGKQVRDVLHILDLFSLIDVQVHDITKFNGDIFNVGGGKECSISLLELTGLCEEITGNKITIDPIYEARLADVRTYITDNTKISDISGWKPKKNLTVTITNIHEWISSNQRILYQILN